MARRLTLLSSVLVLALVTACGGPTITGVVSVQILGGDRDVTLASTALFTPSVTAGSGVSTAVTWSSNNEAVATVGAGGVVTAHALGTATVTATSTADATKSGSAVVTVVAPTAADGAFMTTVVPPAGVAPFLGAGLVLISTQAPPPVTPAAVVDLGYPIFVGPISPIGADGTVVVTLPLGSDLPADVLTTADQFYLPIDEMAGCSLIASAPSVKVTGVVFELVTVPGVILFGVDGASLAIASNIPIDLSSPPTPEVLAQLNLFTWVYAESDVTVVTSGAGCETVGSTLAIDVDLATGWNLLAWQLEIDAVTDALTGIRLTNSDATESYVTPAGF